MTALAFAAAFIALLFAPLRDNAKIFLGIPLIIAGAVVIINS